MHASCSTIPGERNSTLNLTLAEGDSAGPSDTVGPGNVSNGSSSSVRSNDRSRSATPISIVQDEAAKAKVERKERAMQKTLEKSAKLISELHENDRHNLEFDTINTSSTVGDHRNFFFEAHQRNMLVFNTRVGPVVDTPASFLNRKYTELVKMSMFKFGDYSAVSIADD
ncbi:hypothetical protein TKK_0011977 [Trichogramma kaykai]